MATILGYLFTADNELSPGIDISLKMATSVGVIIGPLVFGWLADHYGRKRTCMPFSSVTLRKCYLSLFLILLDGSELLIMAVCTLCQAIAGESPAVSIIGALIFWRVL